MPAERPNGGVVRHRQRLVVVLDADHARHRPEDFFASDPHAGVVS